MTTEQPDGAPRPDEVDRIIAAWGRERPDLDLAPLAVMSRLTRLGRKLDLARRQAFERNGLESWEFDVLAALRRAGAPYALSPGALVTETMVTSGTMTNRVDRLVARGLVARQPAPGDRRGVLVTICDEGLARVDAAFTDLLAVERELLAPVPADEQPLLAASLHGLLTQFDR